MVPRRIAVGKKLRFEVFKRDKFKCQYCGARAEDSDVILHIDHIVPVSKGGKNTLVNLITACAGCNQGKSAVQLDDATALTKQRKQIEELAARRETALLMAEWRNQLDSEADLLTTKLQERWHSLVPPFTLARHGLVLLRTWLRDFGFNEVCDAMDLSMKYLNFDAKGVPEVASVQDAFKKIGGICYNRKNWKRD